MSESPFIEALKYDERIWRAFQTLKTVHREGFLEALAKASGDEIQRLTGALEMRKPSQVAELEEALAAMTVARDEAVEACREVVRRGNSVHDVTHENKLLLGHGIHEFLHYCIGASRDGETSGPRAVIGKVGAK